MVQLLKTETFLKRANETEIEELLHRIYIDANVSDIRFITASSNGYIKKSEKCISLYNGRYGTGLSVFSNNPLSTRYCNKTYIIFDMEYETFKKLVNNVLNTSIEEGENKWQ